ncbi:putative integrase [Cupriavidus taiwanensis]|uniref:Integrase n=1 Tax=Cupriavidus taiwanensis TaxID=164546 RepID=A0A375DW84_9BURK|nr:integrase arm-type DNA-binding domain-containing protein [Cupriavidus taiwanensis]SOZ49053.1 putative integrase [Cupriavidus taiwanensis]SOZ49081.1 putative integrase [Cupriavidus taiwanensis]SOZ51763.1 putative integrase [Cupriavidus taiwanensis]SPA07016.1 putative integrase [Cupriavidus taiwanensis]
MPLTATEVQNAKARDKLYRLTDGEGMYLEVRPNGARYWFLKYRYAGKENRLSLGVFPTVSLKEARERRAAARHKLAAGVDPVAAKQAEKRTQRLNAENSFEAVAREWWAKFAPALSESHAQRNLRRLEVHVFPYVGGQPIAQIEAPAVLDVLQRIEKKGTLETAHRVRVLVGQVVRYAISTGRATRDVSADLRDALPPTQVKHHGAITDPVQLGALLRAIDGYAGTAVVAAALRLAPLVFQRPGELRQAEWTEFDLDAAMWTVPAGRMKRTKAGKENGPDHLVPLSRQAVAILRGLNVLTGRGRFVFPSLRGGDRCMSDMALSAAFKRMGFDSDTALPHGWRATARTLAVEVLGVPAEVVEMQLAHGVRDSLGRAYNRTQWLDQRRELMQRWADYLDELKAGAKVLPFATSVSA